MSYFSGNYWSTNYWAEEYWVPSSGDAETPTTGSGYWSAAYWAPEYWANEYWPADIGLPVAEDTGELVRMFVFGIDPDNGLNSEYQWSVAQDGNMAGKAITCAYVPRSEGNLINLTPDIMFFGGLNLDGFFETFNEEFAQDNEEVFRAEWLTQIIAPLIQANQPLDTVRFVTVEFPQVNPLEHGIKITFAKEADNPHKEPAVFYDVDANPPNSIAGFPSAVAKWIHIRGVDDSQIVGRAVFDGFHLNFYRLSGSQGDDD